jgi:hypothetical protein
VESAEVVINPHFPRPTLSVGARTRARTVEQPTKFELAINLRTAKAMGHELPTELVLRADKRSGRREPQRSVPEGVRTA